MLTERLKAVMDAAQQLPPERQDEIAAAIEEALKRASTQVPHMAPDVRTEFDRVRPDLAATFDYLKDK